MGKNLDERKKRILKAIIQTYLETGEPVGSRTIAKQSDLNLSSATIRNEMSDLEEMGYIMQPHTSAGRTPSDAGYRLYVDEIILEKDKQITQIQEMMIEKTDKMEKVLQQVAKLLATDTNYTSLISAPQFGGNRLKFIQLSRVNDLQLLAVIVTEGNMIRNTIIDLDECISDEIVLRLNLLLNTNLNGLPVADISLGLISALKEQAGDHREIVSRVLDAVANVISIEDDLEIYTSGATNIFKYPELSDSMTAQDLLTTFEEKRQLEELVRETVGESKGTEIQVYIGDETPVKTMKDCSVVAASYELGDGMKGTIAIVGPKRMDYEKVVDSLKSLKGQLDHIFKK
ncbi:MAG: heat-inducible transcriptional repressor HrcA [Lachnospiraceae bacterium]